ncbi:hypothetical protein TELCIR_21298 [Teladorsagia circumcincta]|uniref:Uncharacterized protein n=1 Tax=Teladorsagia circumcincta TaxID=45464 RepID=A0A2G9TH73_TELCI|nr:hypothetical protein TELCIR_21298 [Teladorsagia circumcincta]
MQICEDRKVVVLGEGSVLFLIVAPVSSAVTVVDSNPHFRDIISKYISYYNFKNVNVVENVADVSTESAVLYGICEKFDHLQNTAAPVGIVNGFDLSLFDDISQKARQATDALVDIHPLWEYEGVVSGKKFEVLRFDLRQEPHDVEVNFEVPCR